MPQCLDEVGASDRNSKRSVRRVDQFQLKSYSRQTGGPLYIKHERKRHCEQLDLQIESEPLASIY